MRISHVPGEPCFAYDLISDTGGISSISSSQHCQHGPQVEQNQGLPQILCFGAQYRPLAITAYCFVPFVTAPHARLVSGWRLTSTGRDWLPARFQIQGFKFLRFHLQIIPLDQASCRTAASTRCRLCFRSFGLLAFLTNSPYQ